MLQAELHNKFDFETLDFERSEDILTSTVFGTLLIADGGQRILREWLQRARFEENAPSLHVPGVLARYRFWPRLEGCVPDLAIRFDDFVCVVEVKYRSGASDVEVDDVPERRRQLHMQWKACVSGRKLTAMFEVPRRFENAVVLYVVDGVRGVAASKRAVDEARKCEADSRIGLLFWQDLHATLLGRLDTAESGRLWMEDLALLLRRRQLGTFSGFATRRDSNAPRHSALVRSWRRRAAGFERALRGMNRERASTVAAAVRAWRSQR